MHMLLHDNSTELTESRSKVRLGDQPIEGNLDMVFQIKMIYLYFSFEFVQSMNANAGRYFSNR